MAQCKVCSKNTITFTLPVKVDDDQPDTYDQFHVCGSCWEIIAEISRRATISQISALEQRLHALEEKLERFHEAYPLADLG